MFYTIILLVFIFIGYRYQRMKNDGWGNHDFFWWLIYLFFCSAFVSILSLIMHYFELFILNARYARFLLLKVFVEIIIALVVLIFSLLRKKYRSHGK